VGDDLDVDDGVVLLPVPYRQGSVLFRRLAREIDEEPGHVLGWVDVLERHLEELGPRVTVVLDGRIVHGQELERLPLDHPHRERALLEEHPVRFLGLAQALRHAPGLGDVLRQPSLVLGPQLLEPAEAAEARPEDHGAQSPGSQEGDAEAACARGKPQRRHDADPAEQGHSGHQGQPPEGKEDGTRGDHDEGQHQALQGIAEHAQVEQHDQDRDDAAAGGERLGPSLGQSTLAEGEMEPEGQDRGRAVHEDERPFGGPADRSVQDRDHRLEDGEAEGERGQGVAHDAIAVGLELLRIHG
jgi:hypothetical protein